MGHLGLTPQSVHQLGGYRVQGRDDESAKRIVEGRFESVGLVTALEFEPEPLLDEMRKLDWPMALEGGATEDAEGAMGSSV